METSARSMVRARVSAKVFDDVGRAASEGQNLAQAAVAVTRKSGVVLRGTRHPCFDKEGHQSSGFEAKTRAL